MWPVRVIVLEVLTENSNQMCLVQDDDVIKALATDRADQALGVSVLPRRPRGRQHFRDSETGNPRANDISVDTVTVPDDKSWCFVEGKGLGKLLRRPPACWICRCIEVYDAASIETEDDEAVEDTVRHGWHRKEVDRGEVFEMVVDERLPGLWTRTRSADPIFPDRGLGHMDTQQSELISKPWHTPRQVVTRHLSEELTDLRIDLRSSVLGSSRLPSPVKLEALVMPFDYGVGLDNDQATPPIRPDP